MTDATTSSPADSPTAAAYSTDLLAKLGQVFPQAALQIGVIYGPAVARMTLTELLALDDYVKARKGLEAFNALRSRMTADELAAEKVQLAGLTAKMAEENANA